MERLMSRSMYVSFYDNLLWFNIISDVRVHVVLFCDNTNVVNNIIKQRARSQAIDHFWQPFQRELARAHTFLEAQWISTHVNFVADATIRTTSVQMHSNFLGNFFLSRFDWLPTLCRGTSSPEHGGTPTSSAHRCVARSMLTLNQ